MNQTSVDLDIIPVHLGLILDGNRRWAKAQGKPTLEGHKTGYDNLKKIGKEAINRGVKYVSAYVFSTENWQRSQEEVSYLMKLLLWVAKNDVKELNEADIKVKFIGSREKLADNVLKAIDAAEELTSNNKAGTLLLCLNYGGQQEIVASVNKVLAENPDKSEVTLEDISSHLNAPEVPPVDLIIRTSGELRISNFMLWRAAYSELYFADVHWPAFDVPQLDKALKEFANRQRRFGK